MVSKDSDSQDLSKVKSAAFALATGWESYMKNNSEKINSCISEMRKTAIDVICEYKYADDSVYDSLEKSYINNFISAQPDYEEIEKTLNALGAINTDKSIEMLILFLKGLHQKRSNDIWSIKEEIIFPWIIGSLGETKNNSKNVWNLLVLIYRFKKYSKDERLAARNALMKIKEANQTTA